MTLSQADQLIWILHVLIQTQNYWFSKKQTTVKKNYDRVCCSLNFRSTNNWSSLFIMLLVSVTRQRSTYLEITKLQATIQALQASHSTFISLGTWSHGMQHSGHLPYKWCYKSCRYLEQTLRLCTSIAYATRTIVLVMQYCAYCEKRACRIMVT